MLGRLLAFVIGLSLLCLGALFAFAALAVFVKPGQDTSRLLAILPGVIAAVCVVVGMRLLRKSLSRRDRDADDSDSRRGDGDRDTDDSYPRLRYVSVDKRGRIHVDAQSPSEARFAVKELRVLKKAFAVQRRQFTVRQQAIRAQYTGVVRKRGSMFHGGGGFGKVVRGFQRASRDTSRSQLANALEPLEQQKQRVESVLFTIDGLIAETEAYALGG